MKLGKRLAVKTEQGYQWVFCYDQGHRICTTQDKRKALKPRDLEYFRNHFDKTFNVFDQLPNWY